MSHLTAVAFHWVPTVEWRLPALHQCWGSVHTPSLMLVAVVPVPAVAAVPCAAQWDVHANVEGPVTWRKTGKAHIDLFCKCRNGYQTSDMAAKDFS